VQWLFFVSHRTGCPQIFAERRETGDLIQLTDRDDLNEWSLHPSHDGRHVYFTTSTAGWRLEMESFREERIVDFAGAKKAAGTVGAGMGTTTLSHDDQWWAIPLRQPQIAQLLVVNTHTGESRVACENDSIGHPQFHPQDSSLLRYGGPYDRRIWITNRDGSHHRLVYDRDAAKKEWIVYECWRPYCREILTTNWPHGVMAIPIDSGKARWIARFNAWHPMVDPTGTRMIADTKHPDIGLQMFEIDDQPTAPRLLCRSNASSAGDHWNTDHCPYDDGPVAVFAPQHTHPHPSFSPCGRYVVFTSDRNGMAQLYEASVTDL
jgi:oligogalacturonide lyase